MSRNLCGFHFLSPLLCTAWVLSFPSEGHAFSSEEEDEEAVFRRWGTGVVARASLEEEEAPQQKTDYERGVAALEGDDPQYEQARLRFKLVLGDADVDLTTVALAHYQLGELDLLKGDYAGAAEHFTIAATELGGEDYYHATIGHGFAESFRGNLISALGFFLSAAKLDGLRGELRDRALLHHAITSVFIEAYRENAMDTFNLLQKSEHITGALRLMLLIHKSRLHMLQGEESGALAVTQEAIHFENELGKEGKAVTYAYDQDIPYALIRAKALWGLERYDEVRTFLEPVLSGNTEKGEKFARAYELLGDSYVLESQWGPAAEAYEGALNAIEGVERVDVNPFAKKLCGVYRAQGRYSEIIPLAEKRLESHRGIYGPLLQTAYKEQGDIAFRRNDYLEAAAKYKLALDLCEDGLIEIKVHLAIQLIRAHFRLQNYVEVLEISGHAFLLADEIPLEKARVHHLVAQAYAKSNDYSKAEEHYRETLGISEAERQRRRVEMQEAGESSQIDEVGQPICHLPGPEAAAAHYEYGGVILKLGRGDKQAVRLTAMGFFKAALDTEGITGHLAAKAFDAYYEIASRAGLWSDVVQYSGASRQAGFSPEEEVHALVMIGHANAKLGNFEECLSQLDAAYEVRKQGHLVTSEVCKQRIASALKAIVTGSDESLEGGGAKERAFLLARAGAHYSRIGGLNETIEALTRATKIDDLQGKEKARAFHELGEAYRQRGDLKKANGDPTHTDDYATAKRAFNAAISREGWAGLDRNISLGYLAYVQFMLGDLDEAIQTGKSALESDDIDASQDLKGVMQAFVHHTIGRAYEVKEEYGEAIKAYEKARTIREWKGHHLVQTLLPLGRCYVKNEQEKESIPVYQVILGDSDASDGEKRRAARKLERVYRHLGQYENATAMANRFLEAGGGSPKHVVQVHARRWLSGALSTANRWGIVSGDVQHDEGSKEED